MNGFAEKLKEARKDAGLTQHAMAERTMIPFRTLQQWEGDQRTPPQYVQRFVLNELKQIKTEKEKQQGV
jgi:transcriptional regulator with XRE-family HTH domain